MRVAGTLLSLKAVCGSETYHIVDLTGRSKTNLVFVWYCRRRRISGICYIQHTYCEIPRYQPKFETRPYGSEIAMGKLGHTLYKLYSELSDCVHLPSNLANSVTGEGDGDGGEMGGSRR
jgi:hypothetical protein